MDFADESERVKEVAKKYKLLEKQTNDKPFIIMLIFLGLTCLILATIITSVNNLHMNKEGGGLFIIGGILVFGAYYWKDKNTENIVKVNKKIDDDKGDVYKERRIR